MVAMSNLTKMLQFMHEDCFQVLIVNWHKHANVCYLLGPQLFLLVAIFTYYTNTNTIKKITDVNQRWQERLKQWTYTNEEKKWSNKLKKRKLKNRMQQQWARINHVKPIQTMIWIEIGLKEQTEVTLSLLSSSIHPLLPVVNSVSFQPWVIDSSRADCF